MSKLQLTNNCPYSILVIAIALHCVTSNANANNNVGVKAAWYSHTRYDFSNTFISYELKGSINHIGANWIVENITFALIRRDIASSNNKTIKLSAAPNSNINEGSILGNKLHLLGSHCRWYYGNTSNLAYSWSPIDNTQIHNKISGSIIGNRITKLITVYQFDRKLKFFIG